MPRHNYSTLSNLARYYEAEGRAHEAQGISERVDRYRRHNPYYRYFVAKLLYEGGQWNEAQEILKSAIRMKKNEPEFYMALAQISQSLGNAADSDRYLSKAKRYRNKTHENPPERSMSHRLIVRKNI